MSDINKLVKDVAEVIQEAATFSKEKDFKQITQTEAVTIIQMIVKYQMSTGAQATSMTESLDRIVTAE